MPKSADDGSIADLHRARRAAKECERVAAQLSEFAERLSVVVEPADLVEYDVLIGREAAALSDRVVAFQRLGLGATSIDDEVEPPTRGRGQGGT